MPDDSLRAGRTVARSKPDNGAGRNSSGLSTDLVKIYKECEFTIPSTFYYRFGVKRNPHHHRDNAQRETAPRCGGRSQAWLHHSDTTGNAIR